MKWHPDKNKDNTVSPRKIQMTVSAKRYAAIFANTAVILNGDRVLHYVDTINERGGYCRRFPLLAATVFLLGGMPSIFAA